VRAVRDLSILFSSFTSRQTRLRSRIVVVPLTRNRATSETDAPDRLNAICDERLAGMLRTPGIASDEEITGWCKFNAAIHAAEGVIYLQFRQPARFAQVLEDLSQAMDNAIAAGFDGVEIRGANGSLIQRRMRAPFRPIDAVTKVAGVRRGAVRLSPVIHPFMDDPVLVERKSRS
jgi:2,4-dienoyl-CoA reductase-like NADH-dependent reductase (Old Yellow Enzyme family)